MIEREPRWLGRRGRREFYLRKTLEVFSWPSQKAGSCVWDVLRPELRYLVEPNRLSLVSVVRSKYRVGTCGILGPAIVSLESSFKSRMPPILAI